MILQLLPDCKITQEFFLRPRLFERAVSKSLRSFIHSRQPVNFVVLVKLILVNAFSNFISPSFYLLQHVILDVSQLVKMF